MHDYKTGSPLPKQEELDEDRQLAMYSLWVRRRFKDFKKVRLVWHFLAVDKEMDFFRTKKELEDLREKVLEQIKVSVVFGSDNKITVKESECIKLPAKNSDKRKELNEVLRGVGKLDDVSELDIHALARVLKNRKWDEEESSMLKGFWEMEKSYRLSVSKK